MTEYRVHGLSVQDTDPKTNRRLPADERRANLSIVVGSRSRLEQIPLTRVELLRLASAAIDALARLEN